MTTNKQIQFLDGSFEHMAGSNTFRLGMAFGQTLKIGQTVDATNEDGEVMGQLIISDLFSGTLREMLSAHFKENHFAKEYPETRSRDLKSYLEETYKADNISDSTMFSVLYFEQSEIEEAEFIEGQVPSEGIVSDNFESNIGATVNEPSPNDAANKEPGQTEPITEPVQGDNGEQN